MSQFFPKSFLMAKNNKGDTVDFYGGKKVVFDGEIVKVVCLYGSMAIYSRNRLVAEIEDAKGVEFQIKGLKHLRKHPYSPRATEIICEGF